MGEVIVFLPRYMGEFSGACRCVESLRAPYSFTVSQPGKFGCSSIVAAQSAVIFDRGPGLRYDTSTSLSAMI